MSDDRDDARGPGVGSPADTPDTTGAADSVVASDVDEAIEEILTALEGATRYRDWLVSLCRDHLGEVGRLLEVGAGRGTYTPSLRALAREVVAVEPSPRGVRALREVTERLSGVEVVEGVVDDVPLSAPAVDGAVMLNVLEHVADDAGLLRSILDRTRPGGRLVVWVPACPALLGEFDRRIGHLRRYRRRELWALAASAGWTVEECRYANLPGFAAWWLLVRVLGRTPTSGGAAALYDRWIVPLVRWVEGRVRPPIGQSLLLVARRDG